MSVPKIGNIYAVTQGDYVGSNLVLIDKIKDHYHFLNLPEMNNMEIDHDTVKQGVDHGILELLEPLPDDIMNVCKIQHEKNINTRQQQPTL
jgi:hypothetical protein